MFAKKLNLQNTGRSCKCYQGSFVLLYMGNLWESMRSSKWGRCITWSYNHFTYLNLGRTVSRVVRPKQNVFLKRSDASWKSRPSSTNQANIFTQNEIIIRQYFNKSPWKWFKFHEIIFWLSQFLLPRDNIHNGISKMLAISLTQSWRKMSNLIHRICLNLH